jgi:hypothetical protein
MALNPYCFAKLLSQFCTVKNPPSELLAWVGWLVGQRRVLFLIGDFYFWALAFSEQHDLAIQFGQAISLQRNKILR